MSTQITTRVKLFISAIGITFILHSAKALAEWTVDFSRRTQQTHSQDLRQPASLGEMPIEVPAESNLAPQAAPASPSFFETVFQSNDIAQEIVVLNTEKGFIPSTIRVKKGLNYQIHVVNVNEKEKNVSFVLDSFSEHHATYYGKIKSFVIRPQKEGVYKFVSPETSAQGKLVVFPANANSGAEARLPASAE